MAALFSALVALTAGLRAFLILYFIIALSTVLLAFHKSLRPEPEEVWVARIKETTQKLSPKLFNVAILLKHGSPQDKGWRAAVSGFEPPFTQVIVKEGRMRCESRVEALRHLHGLLQVQLERERIGV